MEKEILQNNFETVYKEYKDYASYIDSIKEESNSQVEDFKKRAVSGNEEESVLVSALFDLSIKPIQHQTDLKILRDRLIAVFDAYKILLEFPEEIKEEIKNLIRPIQIYSINNGKEIEINKDMNDKMRAEAKIKHSELVNAIRTNKITSS